MKLDNPAAVDDPAALGRRTGADCSGDIVTDNERVIEDIREGQ